MRSDINAAIAGKANYLTALGLVSYTEVLGGLRTGKLGVRNHSSKNFNAFWHTWDLTTQRSKHAK